MINGIPPSEYLSVLIQTLGIDASDIAYVDNLLQNYHANKTSGVRMTKAQAAGGLFIRDDAANSIWYQSGRLVYWSLNQENILDMSEPGVWVEDANCYEFAWPTHVERIFITHETPSSSYEWKE